MRSQVDKAAADAGLRLTKTDGADSSFMTDALDRRPVSERVANMYARIVRIVEGDKCSTYEQSLKNSACPDLAREYLRLFVWFKFDRFSPPPAKGRDENPFRGLSDVDASRMLMRLLEDICDRSTGRMGPWTNGISVTQAARR